MKFNLVYSHPDGLEYSEHYDKDVDDPVKWGQEIIEYYNKTLYPGDIPRKFVRVEIKDTSNANHHKWYKQTDGMSVRFRGTIVDVFRCSICGITGKRYGLNGQIKIDSKYRKKAFQNCDTALEELKRTKSKSND